MDKNKQIKDIEFLETGDLDTRKDSAKYNKERRQKIDHRLSKLEDARAAAGQILMKKKLKNEFSDIEIGFIETQCGQAEIDIESEVNKFSESSVNSMEQRCRAKDASEVRTSGLNSLDDMSSGMSADRKIEVDPDIRTSSELTRGFKTKRIGERRQSQITSQMNLPGYARPAFENLDELPYETLCQKKDKKTPKHEGLYSAGRKISDSTVKTFLFRATEPRDNSGHHQAGRPRVQQPRQWETIVPLATPRNKPLALCEVCSSRARVMCSNCRVTFYCTEEHFEKDEFHPKCCFLLQIVRTPPKVFPTRRERDRQAKELVQRKNELVNRVTTVGILSLSTEKFEVANASFNQAICYGKTLLGDRSLYVAKLFMLKAECSLQLGSVVDAEKEMAAGEIVYREHIGEGDFMKENNDQEIVAISGQLAQVRAMVHMAHQQWELALFFISESIYQYSRLYGPDSLKSARCYFLMGEIFFRKSQYSVSETLYVHSLQNYLDWLVVVFEDNYMANKQQSVFDRLVSSQHDNKDNIKDIELPMQIEGEIVVHLKRLHQIFRNRKDFIYGKVLAAFTILAFIRGMIKFADNFAQKTTTYMDSKKDRQLKDIIAWIQRRTRRYMASLSRAASIWGPGRKKTKGPAGGEAGAMKEQQS